MGTRIYVGNLSYDTTEEGLRRHFESEDRTVRDVHIVSDHVTGRSRGFAFVEVGDDAQLNAAIETLNGTTLDGRQLNLSEARPRQSRPDSGGGGRPPRGPRPSFDNGPGRPPPRGGGREPRGAGGPPAEPWPPPDPEAGRGGRGERRKRNRDRSRNEDREDDDW